MGGWKSVKGLFWQSEEPTTANPAAVGDSDLSDEDFAAFLADDTYGVSPEANPPLQVIDMSSVHVSDKEGAAVVDFQEQYDLAQIPNTDEVEQLEAFLTRLDDGLPVAARQAAATAFLGAVGRSTQDVMADAERKIRVVRRLLAGKEQATKQQVLAEQRVIEELQRQINERQSAMEQAEAGLRAFRQSCIVEEGRLQAARVFFGHVNELSGGSQS